jgi:hypothetical protein
MARGGPALRPEGTSKTSFVGEKRSLVLRGEREISVRFPVTVAAWRGQNSRFKIQTPIKKKANIEHRTLNIQY